MRHAGLAAREVASAVADADLERAQALRDERPGRRVGASRCGWMVTRAVRRSHVTDTEPEGDSNEGHKRREPA